MFRRSLMTALTSDSQKSQSLHKDLFTSTKYQQYESHPLQLYVNYHILTEPLKIHQNNFILTYWGHCSLSLVPCIVF